MLSVSRNYGWLQCGWRLCKEVLKNCGHCKRRLAEPQPPPQAPLHANRSPIDKDGPVRAFQRVGLDIFGPFFLKENKSDNKRYVLIFTCFIII